MELVNRLAATGLPRIEAVSFVRDDAVPQMAGAEEVVAGIERRDGVEYVGLVLNEKGFERFAASGLDRVNLTLGATESFNQRNANTTLDEAVERVTSILAHGRGATTVTISVAFGCPFEGRVDPPQSPRWPSGSRLRTRSSSRTRSASQRRARSEGSSSA